MKPACCEQRNATTRPKSAGSPSRPVKPELRDSIRRVESRAGEVQGDAFIDQVLRGGLRPSPEACSRRVRRGEVGDRLLHRARRDEADPAPSGRPHVRHGLAHEADGRQEVRVDRRFERARRPPPEPVPFGGPPAFATRTCRAPNRSTVASTSRAWRIRLGHVRREREHVVAQLRRGRRSALRSRELIATVAPSSTNACADARPSPFDAAVTSATFPASPRSMASDATLPRGATREPPHARRLPSSCSSRWRPEVVPPGP